MRHAMIDGILQAASRIVRPALDQGASMPFFGMVVTAALLFTVGGIFMKLSEGLTRFWPTVVVFILFAMGAALQTLAMKREDLAVTYMAVLGLESILAFLFGVVLFSESCTPARVVGVVLIAGGILSLRSLS